MLRLALRNLQVNTLRLLLTTAAIAIGVAFVVGTFVLSDTTAKAFDQLYEGLTSDTDVVVRAEAAYRDGSFQSEARPLRPRPGGYRGRGPRRRRGRGVGDRLRPPPRQGRHTDPTGRCTHPGHERRRQCRPGRQLRPAPGPVAAWPVGADHRRPLRRRCDVRPRRHRSCRPVRRHPRVHPRRDQRLRRQRQPRGRHARGFRPPDRTMGARPRRNRRPDLSVRRRRHHGGGAPSSGHLGHARRRGGAERQCARSRGRPRRCSPGSRSSPRCSSPSPRSPCWSAHSSSGTPSPCSLPSDAARWVCCVRSAPPAVRCSAASSWSPPPPACSRPPWACWPASGWPSASGACSWWSASRSRPPHWPCSRARSPPHSPSASASRCLRPQYRRGLRPGSHRSMHSGMPRPSRAREAPVGTWLAGSSCRPGPSGSWRAPWSVVSAP